jgi:hypothetical protein
LTEGYSQRTRGETFERAGCTLLLTLDCGVLAHDPGPCANSAWKPSSLTIIRQAKFSPSYAVINPNRQDDVSALVISGRSV